MVVIVNTKHNKKLCLPSELPHDEMQDLAGPTASSIHITQLAYI